MYRNRLRQLSRLLSLLLFLGASLVLAAGLAPKAALAQGSPTAKAQLPSDWVIQGVGKGRELPLLFLPSRNGVQTGSVRDGDPVERLRCLTLLAKRWCEVRKLSGDQAKGFLLAAFVAEVVAAPEPDDGYTGGPDYWQVKGLKKGEVLNIRREPSGNAKVLATLSEGERVRNLGCRPAGSGRWCRIQSLEGVIVTGWVNGRYLREAAAPPPPKPEKPQKPQKPEQEVEFWIVTGVGPGDRLNVRQAPNSQATVLGTLAPGEKMRNLGCEETSRGRWCLIRTLQGPDITGYVSARFLTSSR